MSWPGRDQLVAVLPGGPRPCLTESVRVTGEVSPRPIDGSLGGEAVVLWHRQSFS